jgi:hypothetical protein
MGAPHSRRPLHKLQPVRCKDAHQRARLDVGEAFSPYSVEASDLGLAPLDADLEHMALRAVDRECDVGNRLAATDQVRVPGGSKRTAHTAHVERLQEIGLPSADRSLDDRDSPRQDHLQAFVATKVAEL